MLSRLHVDIRKVEENVACQLALVYKYKTYKYIAQN